MAKDDKISEKRLTGYSTEYVKSNPVTGFETRANIKNISEGYAKDYSGVVNEVYRIGSGILKINDEAEQEKEFIRVNNSLAELRTNFYHEWDSPEALNFNSQDWLDKRDKALVELETAEKDIISNSNLHEPQILKVDSNSKQFHRENQIDFDFKRADHQKNVNIDMFSNEIDNKMLLGASARNMAEQKIYYQDVNSAIKGMLRYGVSPAKLQEKVLNNLKQVVKVNAYKQIKDIMKGATYEDFEEREAKSTAILQNSVRGGMALLHEVEGFSDSDSGEIAKLILNESASEVGDYIDQRRDIITSQYQRQIEIDTNKAIRKAEIEEKKRKSQDEEAQKIIDETTKYNLKVNDLREKGDTLGLFAHVNGLSSPITVSDLAFNPSIRSAVSNTVFDGEFNLQTQGEIDNTKIGNFLPSEMVEEFKGGVGEIETNQGAEGVLNYAKNFAKEKIETDGYDVAPDIYEKTLNGVAYELLTRAGKTSIAKAMKNIAPEISKASISDNLRMVNMTKNKNTGQYKPNFDADREALRNLDMRERNWMGKEGKTWYGGEKRLDADETRFKSTVNKIQNDLVTRYKLSPAQAEIHAINLISTVIKDEDAEFYKDFYNLLEPKTQARKIGQFINDSKIFNDDEGMKKITDSYFQVIVNPYIPTRKIPKKIETKPITMNHEKFNFTSDPEKNSNANMMYPIVDKYAKKYGLDTATAMGQWAMETGWGIKASKTAKESNSMFGIKAGSNWKGKTVILDTHEEVSVADFKNDYQKRGFEVVGTLENGNLRVKGKDRFRAYDTVDEAVEDYMKLRVAKYKNNLKGYATDSGYLKSINDLVEHNFTIQSNTAKN